jgi:predicted CXXCH cytochrome family protein
MATRRGSARTILLLATVVATRAAAQSGDTASQCVGCHTDQLTAVGTTGGHSPLVDCLGCHADRRPNRVGRRHRAKPNCSDCHAEPSGHPPRKTEPRGVRATRNCLACHDVHGSTNLHLVTGDLVRQRRVFPITFTSKEGAAPGGFTDPAHPGRGLCEVCHRATDFYRHDGRGKPHFTQTCTLCHLHAEHFEPVATEANCSICHADEAARFTKPSGHSARFECGGCHAEVSPTPGRGHRAVEACQSCHPDRATHAPTGPPGLPCTQCHDPHGTGNANLVLDVLTTTAGTQVPIRFDNLDGLADGSFASPSAPGTGVCEVCHTTTRFYRADGTGEPHFTYSCLPCHLHANGFQPQ